SEHLAAADCDTDTKGDSVASQRRKKTKTKQNRAREEFFEGFCWFFRRCCIQTNNNCFDVLDLFSGCRVAVVVVNMHQIRLEKVLGVTVSNNAALTSDNTGIIAYPAGCTVVLFNTVTERQSHIINVNRKTITSLAFSSCGRYIVTGECGHQPAVRVWDLQSDLQSQHPGLTPQPQQIAEFLGHKYGVNCVAFSPTTKYVVSIGTQHDMIVNVWDWKNNIKVASNKVSTKVKSIAFADNGSYFVTVGNRHVKFWYLEQEKRKYKEAVPLMGRSAILGEQRNNYFCDVACGKADSGDSTYAITRSGLLCEFNNRRLLDKWVELRTSSANCIAVGEKYIFVGCAEGIIRCFDPQLRFVTTLPRTHYLGVDVSLGTNITHMGSSPDNAKYPDAVALTYDEANSKLTCVYNDHSIYVWDVTSIRRVGKSHSFLFHSACIWGVETAPSGSPLPDGTFLTCSSDDTVRFWSLDAPDNASKSVFPQNIYSKELMKVLYIDKELAYLKDLDISGTTNNEKTQESSSYDGRNGVRCIRISPDGKSLASGDRSGNIRVHEMATMKETLKIEAHDAEVLCLEYSPNDPSFNLMASASRDRLIHVFDVKRGYDFVQTLDDHSSSITAVRFLKNTKNLQMVSCGADKSLIFRSLTESDNGKVPQFVRDHNASGKTTLYDMEVDTGQKHVLTACQDRNVRIYSVNNGKHTKSFKGSSGDEGTLIKVVLDRSGIFLATSCTDKSLSVYDYYSGECMATMCGHSELATGLRFTNDCRRLISASGDGCIFVWRVPHDMVITMHARLTQQAMRLGKPLDTRSLGNRTDDGDADATTDANYRFSIGQLPKWAKRQFTEEGTAPPPQNKNVAAPKGRWAQRAETTLGAKSGVYSISPFASIDRRLDGSDGSKDSSLDSGTDLKNYSEFKREIHTATSMQKFSNVTLRSDTRRSIMTDDSAIGDVESTAHDGDIDSDNEYRYRPLYYPTQADSASGSEFTVTNMDQDELRKSQRKKKPPTINLTAANVPYGSNESDEDDDDASTPSGDNTDRNPMSLLSVSSESLDHLVSREKYLQSTFESMSGAENEQTPTNKTSISSKFLRTGERNVEAINAVKMTKNDPDAMRTRQELHKRIADTKKKLESVGHGSPLKYSQSIHDLSHIPVRDTWNNKKQVSGKKSSASRMSTTSRYQKNSSSSMQRSRSTTVLNASDSENDSNDKSNKISRLMRPTISSHNKMNSLQSKALNSRKKQSYSTSNLSTVGVENISTSDDDIDSKKPTAPPRTRSGNYENNNMPHVTPRKHLNNNNNKEKSKASRHTIHFDTTITNDDFNSIESLDLSSIEISNQLCDDTIKKLTKAAENVVQLYGNLMIQDGGDSGAGESQAQIDRVKMSIIRTHKILHDCILTDLRQSNSNIDVNQTDAVKKLNDLVAKSSATSANSVVNVMEQYSDILLDMVQQKIHSSNI
ncbi:unnamed protein product, partial [Brassicogethes aeneus]